MPKTEEMIGIIAKTSNGKILKSKENIKINRCFHTENPNEIGFLCAFKNEITASFAKSVAVRHGNDEIRVSELEIGKNQYTVLIGNKDLEKQLIKAVEDFDRMIRNGNIAVRQNEY
jgi:hypothetical protein